MEELQIERIRRIVVQAVSQVLNPNPKPEHMTHLRGDELVFKDHPRIAFRGAIDSLEADIIVLQTMTDKLLLPALTQDLEEIIKCIRWLLRCEVSGEPVGEVTLQGLSTDELRAHSHHPSQYYGMHHFLPTREHGDIVARLNRLRARVRETELTAYKAFRQENGDVEREDIIRVLNRLSSLFWIMMFKYLTGVYEQTDKESMVEVEASGRHVHLCREDVEALFGPGHQLTRVRDLSQPGQFACEERVSLSGPKGTLHNVIVLGPERKETQAEISKTDALTLGLNPPIRLSGDIDNTPGMILANSDRRVEKEKGVIIAKRHMHITPEDAERLGVKDKEALKIQVFGSRPVIFEDTVARVSKDFATYVHIDYDEANACGFEKGTFCKIVRD